MTAISIEALKEMTIGKICELIKQAERLPDDHSPSQQISVDKREVVHTKKTSDVGSSPISDTKTQTAAELLDEINMEEHKKQNGLPN